MRPLLTLLLAALACAPRPESSPPAPAAESHVSEDMSADPEPAPTAAPPPGPAPLAALVTGAGVRVALDTRGWELAALPGRVVVLDDDFRHLRGIDPATGAELWRSAVQEQPRGRHTLYVVGDRVLLHAGPDLVAVDAAGGAVVGRHPAWGYNGGGDACRLEIVRGLTDVSSVHVAHEPDAIACASVCDCGLRLFRCDTAAPLGEVFHGSVTHLYHSLGEPHDNVCFRPPRLLGQVRGRTLLALEQDLGPDRGKDRGAYVGVALDRDGKELWRRPALALALGRFRAVDGDPAGDVCWSVDSEDMSAWTCSTGHVKWRAAFTDGDDSWGASARLIAPGRLLVRRRSRRLVRAELRELAGGKPLWRRELPAGHVVLTPGEDPRDLVFDPGATFVWVDPRTGATLRELQLRADQALVGDATGGYLHVGGPDGAELDREGRVLRSVPRDMPGVTWVGPRFVVVRDGARAEVLRRPDYTVALAAEGSWSVDDASAALGPDALLLYEHRGEEPLRIVLLRATD